MSQFANRVSICNLVCVFLLIAVIAAQLFLPGYSYVDKDETIDVTLGEYVWFPKDHKDLTKDFQKELGKNFKIDEVSYPHLYIVLVGCFGIVFLIKNHDKKLPSLFALAVGAMCCIYMLTTPAFQSYQSAWASIVLGALLLVLSLVSLLGDLVKKLFTKKPAEKAA